MSMFLSFVSLPPHWSFILNSDIPKKAHYQDKSQISCGLVSLSHVTENIFSTTMHAVVLFLP